MQLDIVGDRRLVTAQMLQVALECQLLQAEHSILHVKIEVRRGLECKHLLKCCGFRLHKDSPLRAFFLELFGGDWSSSFLSSMAISFSFIVRPAS